jgi:hypothetical protein
MAGGVHGGTTLCFYQQNAKNCEENESAVLIWLWFCSAVNRRQSDAATPLSFTLSLSFILNKRVNA